MLASERCGVCRPGTPSLSEDDASALLAQIDGAWELRGGNAKLRRRIATADFAGALSFAVHVGFLAEQEGHHPDLRVHWGRLVVDLTTHAAGGVTRNDFILAAKIDSLCARVGTADSDR